MTGRVLVVDDVKANIRLLEARLGADYFEVEAATSGEEALALVEEWPCDIVLLDVMMPGLDGFEVCRRLKANRRTAHIPVILITALDRVEDRIEGFRAGADDFLTKPVNDLALIARVKNLVGLKRATDELRMRALTGSQFGGGAGFEAPEQGRKTLLFVDDNPQTREHLLEILRPEFRVEVESAAPQALLRAAEHDFDTLIVDLALGGYDALRLCSQLRALERTRLVPIMLITGPQDGVRVIRALELGINDHVARPIEKTEFLLRVRAQVRHKAGNDRLLSDVEETIAMAITDPLTGLCNRRYLQRHLTTQIRQAEEQGQPLALLLLDIDHFKVINDTYGHDVGDVIIREFAHRLRAHTRGLDLACRFGGEEFIVLLPETNAENAGNAAERLRRVIMDKPFSPGNGVADIAVTASIGVAEYQGKGDGGDALIRRADQALYAAKRAGRNRIALDDGATPDKRSGKEAIAPPLARKTVG